MHLVAVAEEAALVDEAVAHKLALQQDNLEQPILVTVQVVTTTVLSIQQTLVVLVLLLLHTLIFSKILHQSAVD
jgi:hypothetical protein